MFITEHLTPAETLSELLALKGYSKADTERFRKLRHNRDLCPGFRERVSVILDAYKSHRTDVRDTQGPRDEGVDVQLNYQYNEGQHRLGLQIKSFKEIEDWASKRDREFIQRLKAQYATAIQNAKIEDYYLLLCTDEIQHEEQIRLICSELKQFETLKIVLPRQALALYECSNAEIQAYVTRLLCRRDSVLEAALDAVRNIPADRAFVLLALVCCALSGQLHVSQQDLFEIYHDWEELNPGCDLDVDRLADLVGELHGAGLSISSGDDGYTIELADLPTALCAMYFDQKQRRAGDLLTSLTALLGVQGKRPAPRRRAAEPT
jgi:hypothetical protein